MFRKARIDLVLVLAVTLVSLAGIFTLYTQDIDAANPSYRWMKQLSFFIIGFIIMLVLRKTNYQALGNVSLPIYGFAILLLIVTFFIGSEIKGARSWIRIGPFGFQTSEFAKLAAVILLAKYLELKEKDMEHITSLIIPFSIFLLPMLLIVIQPDLGGVERSALVSFHRRHDPCRRKRSYSALSEGQQPQRDQGSFSPEGLS